MLEFDSKSHGDVPRNAASKSILNCSSNDSVPVWEHRRRAGSTGSTSGTGSIDLGLFDGKLLTIFLAHSCTSAALISPVILLHLPLENSCRGVSTLKAQLCSQHQLILCYTAPEGQSAEALAAYNKQRLAYVLRSILPAESIVGSNGGASASGASAGM